MVYVYSGSNTTSPIGKVMDYNNTNPSRSVGIYRLLSSNKMSYISNTEQTDFSSNFANAIYGDGPYSLNHPNMMTEQVARRFDALA